MRDVAFSTVKLRGDVGRVGNYNASDLAALIDKDKPRTTNNISQLRSNNSKILFTTTNHDRKVKLGWNLDMMECAMDMGYSMFGLHMLQPKPGVWMVKMLLENRSTQDPYILDPFLASKVHMYINGDTDKIVGFRITDNMARCRQSRFQQR